jgi:hypothetical protein
MTMSTVPQRFAPGTTIVSEEARLALNAAGVSALDLLLRHVQGDWGTLSPQLRQLNEKALTEGAVVLSKYPISPTRSVWLVTSADRTSTTFHLFDGQQATSTVPRDKE